jgi:hypothetical protein
VGVLDPRPEVFGTLIFRTKEMAIDVDVQPCTHTNLGHRIHRCHWANKRVYFKSLSRTIIRAVLLHLHANQDKKTG